MVKRKLNYTIHNPNTVEDTVNHLLKLLIEANAGKVERSIKEAMNNENNQLDNNEKDF